MIRVTISANEENQRLDRFLKKYYRNAPLSYIYKLLRTGVKVNGRRVDHNTRLLLGDEITIDISEEQVRPYLVREKPLTTKRQFQVIFEDDNLLIVGKPFGLLTHGTLKEKNETLANQVLGYLIDSKAYNPKREKTFIPSPANRLDRNTTGLVIFGKNAATLRSLAQMLREKGHIRKYYIAIVHGEIKETMMLYDRMERDYTAKKIKIINVEEKSGKIAETKVIPLKISNGCTLVEVELITGRTHQIRAHLAEAGYPIIGDRKYGNAKADEKIRRKIPLNAQVLHAFRLVFEECIPPLEYMNGKEIRCEMPLHMKSIEIELFGYR